MKSLAETTLSEILERLETGESVQTILTQFPDHKQEARTFLQTAGSLKQLSASPSATAQQRAKNRFLSQVPLPPVKAKWYSWPFLQRGFLLASALVGMFLVFGFTFFSASASALPGDVLYPVKRVTEQFRLYTTLNSTKAIALKESFTQARVQEIKALLARGRNETVALEGNVDAIRSNNWIVALLPWVVDENTLMVGTPVLGDWVKIYGYTEDGILYASQITHLPEGDDNDIDDNGVPPRTMTWTPIPSASPTQTEVLPTPSLTLTPAETLSPTATEITATSSPPPTLTPAITNTPDIPPTSILPSPTDNDDDKDDDGSGNENDDDDDDNDDD